MSDAHKSLRTSDHSLIGSEHKKFNRPTSGTLVLVLMDETYETYLEGLSYAVRNFTTLFAWDLYGGRHPTELNQHKPHGWLDYTRAFPVRAAVLALETDQRGAPPLSWPTWPNPVWPVVGVPDWAGDLRPEVLEDWATTTYATGFMPRDEAAEVPSAIHPTETIGQFFETFPGVYGTPPHVERVHLIVDTSGSMAVENVGGTFNTTLGRVIYPEGSTAMNAIDAVARATGQRRHDEGGDLHWSITELISERYMERAAQIAAFDFGVPRT